MLENLFLTAFPFLLLRDYILTSYPALKLKTSFARGSLRSRKYLIVRRQAWLCTFVGKAQPSPCNSTSSISGIGAARAITPRQSELCLLNQKRPVDVLALTNKHVLLLSVNISQENASRMWLL